MLDDLIDSLDNSSDTELLAISRQIDVSNNNIPDLRDSIYSFKEDGVFLDNRS